jgi:hypothetical protein
MTSQTDFVSQAYSQALAAGLTDTQARLAASQAALETGYGQHVVGNNYFGIKAGPSWNGNVVNAATHEEVNGQSQKQNANFRAYSSPVDSFHDWASTVSKHWPNAFNANDFQSAAQGLNAGGPMGYATDSHYAAKLGQINGMLGTDPSTVPAANPQFASASPAPPQAQPQATSPTMGQQFRHAIFGSMAPLPTAPTADGSIPAAIQAAANPTSGAHNIFGAMSTMAALQPQQQAPAPQRVQGPTPDQANALLKFVQSLQARQA